MIQIRKANERGHADYGWLQANHTFSFGGFHDPEFMGFRALRVMNEDHIQAGKGFGTHPHNDMEIVTYVLEGALEHKDSMGNGEVLRPGEFQRMSAGTGITHSEFNPSPNQPTHLYQIWLAPAKSGIEPSYEQKRFDDEGMRNRLQLVASPDAESGSLKIHQDARIYLTKLDPGVQISHDIQSGRHAWLQVLRGEVTVNGQPMVVSDGVAISEESQIQIVSTANAELMLFDLS